jgi:hypothetical protein
VSSNMALMPMAEMSQLGKAFVESKMFPDVQSVAQAIVKMQAGSELGFPPMVSMRGINIIKGRVELSAGLIAALVKKGGRYNYRITRHTANECAIEWYDGGKLVYSNTFTMADAEKAGLTSNAVYMRFPRNMLFARCLTNGARIVCPEKLAGVDLGDSITAADIIEPGEMIEGMTHEERKQLAAQASADIFGEPAPAPQIEHVSGEIVEQAAPAIPTQRGARMNYILTQGKVAGFTPADITGMVKAQFQHAQLSQCTDDELLALCQSFSKPAENGPDTAIPMDVAGK